jgi:cytoskeletal protein CcmA (bactofilin family)
VIVGNICSPVVTMEEGVRFDGAMQMHHVLEEVVQARTQRAPGALSGFIDEDDDCGIATGRIEAPATRDPSDLLDPENI